VSAPLCAEPLDLVALIDYWLGDLGPDEEAPVEEHLLGCAACSERTADLVALAGGVRRLATLGVVRAVVTAAFLRRLADEGLRVRE
jgi:anti-sigma factor RsiW